MRDQVRRLAAAARTHPELLSYALGAVVLTILVIRILASGNGTVGTRYVDEMSGASGAPVSVSYFDMRNFRRDLHTAVRASGMRYEAPVALYREAAGRYGFETMLAVLEEEPMCHSQAHNLGRVIYEKSGDLASAAATCGSRCSSGCIHGVLMGFFEEHGAVPEEGGHVGIEDLTPRLKESITTACDRSEITRHTGIGNCYHAVGHALMPLVRSDVTDALALCELFRPLGIGAVYYCATGVYMERDIAYGEQHTEDSSYDCTKARFPAACFRYTLRRDYRLPAEAGQVRNWCLSLEGTARTGCFHGLGFGAYHAVYEDPAALNDICGAGSDLDKRLCIEGALGLINIDDTSVSSRACAAYTGPQEVCEAASRVYNFGMQRDFSLVAPESPVVKK